MRSLLPVLALAGLLGAGACLAGGAADAPPPARPAPAAAVARAGAAGAAAPDMRALIAEFASDSASVRDFYTIDRSPARLAREDALDAAWLARLEALGVDALDADGRIDWLLLRNEIRSADNHRAATRVKLTETSPLLPFADEIAALEEARWHLAPVDPEAAATQLDALAKQVKAIKERVEKGKGAKAAEAPTAAPAMAWEPLPPLPKPSQNHADTPWHVHSDLVWWFQSNQHEDGTWPAGESATGTSFDVTATALPLLALMGTGSVPGQRAPATSNVLRGLRALIGAQQADGSFAEGPARASHYGNAVATLALVDGWALTHDKVLRLPAERALRHLVAMRGPGTLWRAAAEAHPAAPLQDEDLWITGWAVLALGLAHDSTLAVDDTALKDALARLDELTDEASGITSDRTFELHPQDQAAPASPGDSARLMTSISLLARLLDHTTLGRPSILSLIHKQVTFIAEQPPAAATAGSGRCAAHDWFFGSTALWFANELRDADAGAAWRAWETSMQENVLAHQQHDGELAGSWDPEADAWCSEAGRACTTALDALTCEVFFRYDSLLGWHLNAPDAEPPYPVAVPSATQAAPTSSVHDVTMPEPTRTETPPRLRDKLFWGRGHACDKARAAPHGQAITSALTWLARHQAADGSWSGLTLDAQCVAHGGPPCGGMADPQHDVGITALALLAMLGDDNTDKIGLHHASVARGLRYLIARQSADGSFAGPQQPVPTLDHIVATMALSETFLMTRNRLFKAPTERALRHLSTLRTPGAGWHDAMTEAGGADLIGDASLTCLALMTAAVARDMRMPDAPDDTAIEEALSSLDAMIAVTPAAGRAERPGAAPGDGASPPSDSPEVLRVAAALLARQLSDPGEFRLGSRGLNDQALAALLASRPGDGNPRDLNDPVTWFFGAHALRQAGDVGQTDWWHSLVDTATRLQRMDDGARGSWDPRDDADGRMLGRVGTTAATAFALEAPWRYQQLAEAMAAALGRPFVARTLLPSATAGNATPTPPPAMPQPPADDVQLESKPAADAPLTTTPVIAQRAARELNGLRRALDTWFAHYDEFSPGFSWWTRKPYDATIAALNDYARLLREDIAGLHGKDEDPLVGDPIGRDALVDDLAAEMIDYSPEELLAIGEREFAWCETQLKLASAEMGFGEDWKAALAVVKADHVPPGEQDRLVTEQAKEAIAFLDGNDLITIPDLCRETWRVRMIDADTQRTLPYAAYGGQDVLVAYPTRDMDTETKLMTMRGNNVHFSRIVVPHELIPGHHLQGFVAARSNTQRGMFSTPFLVEGWALYWEMRFWELGWPQSPEDRIGMLFWRMHRAARIIVSLKFHLGEMQPQEMIDFLVDRVGHEKAGATSEVRRYIGGNYGPLYQCAYMIGGLQLRALHDELVGSTAERGDLGDAGDAAAARPGRTNPATGARWTEREFHDAVLAQNSMPVKLIRAALESSDTSPAARDAMPTRDAIPTHDAIPPRDAMPTHDAMPARDNMPAWRFAGDP